MQFVNVRCLIVLPIVLPIDMLSIVIAYCGGPFDMLCQIGPGRRAFLTQHVKSLCSYTFVVENNSTLKNRLGWDADYEQSEMTCCVK